MIKKSDLTEEFIINGWLTPNFGITVKWLVENESELIKTIDWYKKYSVSQKAHNTWYNWAIDIISKTLRMSKKITKRRFAINYLNCAPNIKKDGRINKSIKN